MLKADPHAQLATSKSSSAPQTSLVMRTVWALLTLVHVWPIALVSGRLIVEPTGAGAASLALLLAVTAFFTAKACDVVSLRSRRQGLELTALFLCALLLHPPSDEWASSELLALAPAAALAIAVSRKRWRPKTLTSWVPTLKTLYPLRLQFGVCFVAVLRRVAITTARTLRQEAVAGNIALPPPRL